MNKTKTQIGLYNDYYGGLLTAYQSELVRLYYDCDLSLGEIAAEYGVTRQAVREVLGRSEKKLLEYEEKLGLTAKLSGIRARIESLLEEPSFEVVQKELAALLQEVNEV